MRGAIPEVTRQRVTEYSVVATGPESAGPVVFVISATSEEEARLEVEEMGYVVRIIRVEPRRPMRMAANTVGCVLLAAFFVVLREIVQHAAGPGPNPLMLLFSWLTMTIATSALVGVLLIWFPHLTATRCSSRHRTRPVRYGPPQSERA